MFENRDMKTKKHNINIKNKTLKIPDFLKPKTLWQKRLKKIADRDLALIPGKLDKYSMKGGYTLLIINNNNIKFSTKLEKSNLKDLMFDRINKLKIFLNHVKL